MAIYTGRMQQEQEKRNAARRIAKQQAKAEKGEAKRKGRAGIFGKLAGLAAGEGLEFLGKKGLEYGLAALTGGTSLYATKALSLLQALKKSKKALKLAKAVKTGGGMFLGRAAAHQATTGKWDKALPFGSLKTPGQVSKIEAGGKYGYGRQEATSLSESLAGERESQEDWGTLAGSIGGAFAADMAGEKLGSLFKGKTDGVKDLLPEEVEASSLVPGGGGSLETLEVDAPQVSVEDPYVFGSEQEDYAGPLSPEWEGAQGGQVPQLDQNTLMALLALAQMQQQETAYSGTPLEETNQQSSSIADMFASKGKTLGGNNTQSLSQILGR